MGDTTEATPPTPTGSAGAEKIYWGVDSVAQSNEPYPHKDSPTTRYDYVMNNYRHEINFFGRYLTPYAGQRIECKEIKFLQERKCRLLLCYNSMSREDVKKDRQDGYNNGLLHGSEAAHRARDVLKVPPVTPATRSTQLRIYIYANIDTGKTIELSYHPTYYWMAGWWDGLWQNGFGPGIYFTAGPGSTLVERSIEKCKDVPDIITISVWTNYTYRDRKIKIIDTPGTCIKAPQSIPTVLNKKDNTIDNTIALGLVDVWQYAGNCLNGAVDLNLATQNGYKRLWNILTRTCTNDSIWKNYKSLLKA